ncbi:MAG: hypothetical protein VYB24_00750, partial [Pseudomonadota bacterium]|nr:hypothetical protein [Pseudomonadota bacterium]
MTTPAIGETLDLSDSIQRFAGRNGAYYVREFNKIQSTSRFGLSFNWGSALAGPVWAGARGLWGLFCCLAILELLMLVPLGQGLWSDLGAEERTRVEKLEHNYDRMLNKAQKAKDKGKTARAAKLQKNADNLNNAMTKAKLRAQKAENTATV